jgi:hypothetical protein
MVANQIMLPRDEEFRIAVRPHGSEPDNEERRKGSNLLDLGQQSPFSGAAALNKKDIRMSLSVQICETQSLEKNGEVQ